MKMGKQEDIINNKIALLIMLIVIWNLFIFSILYYYNNLEPTISVEPQNVKAYYGKSTNTFYVEDYQKGCACCGQFCTGLNCNWDRRYQIDSPICKEEIKGFSESNVEWNMKLHKDKHNLLIGGEARRGIPRFDSELPHLN